MHHSCDGGQFRGKISLYFNVCNGDERERVCVHDKNGSGFGLRSDVAGIDGAHGRQPEARPPSSLASLPSQFTRTGGPDAGFSGFASPQFSSPFAVSGTRCGIGLQRPSLPVAGRLAASQHRRPLPLLLTVATPV